MTDYRSAQLVLAHLLYEDHDGPWSLAELARELRFEPVTVEDAAAHLGGWGFVHRRADLLWPSRHGVEEQPVGDRRRATRTTARTRWRPSSARSRCSRRPTSTAG